MALALAYLGASMALKGNLKALVSSRQHKVPNPLPAAVGVFKGLGHGFQTVRKATVSGLKSMASTAGRLTCFSRPVDKWEIDNASVIGASVMDANDSDDEIATAIVQLRTEAVGAGKVASASQVHAIKTDGLAKYREQQSQFQASLAAADAAASKAACGANLGMVAAGAGDALGMGQLDFFGDMMDCDLSDMAVCTDKAQGDIECVVNDCDGVDEAEWESLLADPEMAAVIANLQAGIKAC